MTSAAAMGTSTSKNSQQASFMAGATPAQPPTMMTGLGEGEGDCTVAGEGEGILAGTQAASDPAGLPAPADPGRQPSRWAGGLELVKLGG